MIKNPDYHEEHEVREDCCSECKWYRIDLVLLLRGLRALRGEGLK